MELKLCILLISLVVVSLVVYLSSKSEGFVPERVREAPSVCENGGCKQCAPNVKCCGFACNNDICGCDASATTQEECNTKHNGNFWCGGKKPKPRPPKPPPKPVSNNQCCTKGTGSACNLDEKGCKATNKQGYFSITFNLNGFEPRPGHVYIRIQRKSASGTDFLIFPGGTDTAVLKSTALSEGTSIVPAEYSRVVEPGDTLYFPTTNFISGRLYVSLFDEVNWLIPNIKGMGDTEPLYTAMEFTIDNSVLWVNISAVDIITMPVLKLVNNQTSAWSGYENAFACTAAYTDGCDPKSNQCCSLYDCVRTRMKDDCPLAGYDSTWGTLFQSRGEAAKIAIISPKHSPNMKYYFKDYLNDTWLPAIRDNGGFYADIDYNIKKIEVSADLVSFVVQGGEVVPTNKDDPEGYWSGGQRFWQGSSPSVLKVVSALLMSGAPIEWVCKNTNSSKAFSKPMALTTEFKSQMHLNRGVVNGVQDMPMYNVYRKALHDCGYCAYAYDYDDELGQDGTERINVTNGACLSLHIQTDDARARSNTLKRD